MTTCKFYLHPYSPFSKQYLPYRQIGNNEAWWDPQRLQQHCQNEARFLDSDAIRVNAELGNSLPPEIRSDIYANFQQIH